MNKDKRRLIEGWVDKAWNHLEAARGHLKSQFRYSECVEASQECVELAVKAALSLLGVEYPPSHGWNREQFLGIAEQIRDKQLVERLAARNLGYSIRLPRLLLLANFWSQFYLQAKYGFEAGHLAPPQDLFGKEEAEFAVRHAEECCSAASQLRSLPEDELMTIIRKSKD